MAYSGLLVKVYLLQFLMKLSRKALHDHVLHQARNQGGQSLPRKIFAPFGKMYWT